MRRRSAYRPYEGRRSIWLRAFLLLALAGVLLFAGLEGAVCAGARSRETGAPKVMVILGCQVKPWGPSVLLQDRLDTALTWLEEHPECEVIVSGAQGPDEHETEARCMHDYLVEHGIGEERIHLEEGSHNTWQNIRESRALIARLGLDTSGGVAVVSNGFHLTRVRMLWARAGGEESLTTLAAPSTHAPTRLKMYLREPLALAKSFLLDR